MSRMLAALIGCSTKSPWRSVMRKRVAAEEFQLWKLAVNLDQHTGVLTCDDGNGNIVYSKRIPFTDFPLQEISLYFCNNTILLPSEY